MQIDIRLICATNMPIHDMVGENTFRQDLLYRINTVEINLPPLRDRIEDIPLLADHFVHSYAKKYRKDLDGVSRPAIDQLQNYNWPGNVRAVIMSEQSELKPEDFFFLSGDHGGNDEQTDVQTNNLNLEEIERSVINKAIAKHGGNISKAAKELGLTRASLYRRLEKHGL